MIIPFPGPSGHFSGRFTKISMKLEHQDSYCKDLSEPSKEPVDVTHHDVVK